jgi:hypothetical protein
MTFHICQRIENLPKRGPGISLIDENQHRLIMMAKITANERLDKAVSACARFVHDSQSGAAVIMNKWIAQSVDHRPQIMADGIKKTSWELRLSIQEEKCGGAGSDRGLIFSIERHPRHLQSDVGNIDSCLFAGLR